MLDRIACFSVYYLKTWGTQKGGCVGWSQETCGAGWVHTSSSAEYHCSWHWLDSNSSRAKRCQEHGTSGNLLRVLVVLVWFSLGLVASSFFSLTCLTSNFMGFFFPSLQSNSFNRFCQTALSALPGCTDHCLCGVTLGALNSWVLDHFFLDQKEKLGIPWSKLDFKAWGVLSFWERNLIIGL